jgi:hypothetical protein
LKRLTSVRIARATLGALLVWMFLRSDRPSRIREAEAPRQSRCQCRRSKNRAAIARKTPRIVRIGGERAGIARPPPVPGVAVGGGGPTGVGVGVTSTVGVGVEGGPTMIVPVIPRLQWTLQ